MSGNLERPGPLTVIWEIEVVDGEEAAALARHQARTVLEVLSWIAEQRRRQDGSAASETS